MGVKAHLAFLLKVYELELSAALEYRFNFLMQTIGMFINDFFWIFFWFIMFSRFQSIGGWNFQHMMLLHSVMVTSFAISVIFFDNCLRLAKLIEEGRMDYYLTLPKNVLLHTLVKTSYSGFGDLMYGILLAFIAIPSQKVPLFLLLISTSSLIFLSWGIFIGSFTFYFQNFQLAARQAREAFISIAFYPTSVYSGTMKFVLLFVIPAGFISSIPVELLTTFSWKLLGFLLTFTALFFLLSVWLFYRGLRRYESGNMIAMRG